jgi:HD-GYP domain-containing protein (c-di-GMP phosphodiesterase class II)
MYRFLLQALMAERAASAELLQTYDATLEGWAHALELRDLETAGHCQRVSNVASRLAGRAGWRTTA